MDYHINFNQYIVDTLNPWGESLSTHQCQGTTLPISWSRVVSGWTPSGSRTPRTMRLPFCWGPAPFTRVMGCLGLETWVATGAFSHKMAQTRQHTDTDTHTHIINTNIHYTCYIIIYNIVSCPAFCWCILWFCILTKLLSFLIPRDTMDPRYKTQFSSVLLRSQARLGFPRLGGQLSLGMDARNSDAAFNWHWSMMTWHGMRAKADSFMQYANMTDVDMLQMWSEYDTMQMWGEYDADMMQMWGEYDANMMRIWCNYMQLLGVIWFHWGFPLL